MVDPRSQRPSEPPPTIERADGGGYVVQKWGLRVFRPTLDSARAAREVLGDGEVAYPPLPRPSGRLSRPPGAVIYGPVQSRRLGRSLGINLMRPGQTVCSFRCVYCEYLRRPCPHPFGEWPSPAAVTTALGQALRLCGGLDSITISGVGEPTEHPDFEVVVDAILAQARSQRPGVPVRILTNGATTIRADVRRALDRLDERIVTVDAAAERVDRPDLHSPLGGIVQGIALLRDFTAQSCFFDGVVSNIDDEAVDEWADRLGEMQPRSVQIFTLVRRSANADLRPVSREQLEEIACVLRERTGIEGTVY